MEYEAYYTIAQRGAQEFEKGDYAAAQSTFASLLDEAISDLDKCATCMNLVLVSEKRGAPAAEVEAWYDRGIAYERPHLRYAATERKADWLAKQGRNRESLRLYEEMLTYRELNDTDRARVRLNCDSLRSAFNRYSEAAQHAAGLLEAGKHDEAIAAFRAIVSMDLSDVDRSMMHYNIARAYERKGEPREALPWYERGVADERPHRRFMVLEGMAYALSQLGRTDDSVRIYEELLLRPELTESDKMRIRNNLAALRGNR